MESSFEVIMGPLADALLQVPLIPSASLSPSKDGDEKRWESL